MFKMFTALKWDLAMKFGLLVSGLNGSTIEERYPFKQTQQYGST